MSFLVIGDPHIGGSLQMGKMAIGSSFNSRVIDQNNLLEFSLDQAVSRGIDTLIITGDTWEEPSPKPNLITLFIAFLKKCAAYGVFVHIIVGNHDILRTGNFYTSPLDIISECELDNVSIHKEINTVLFDGLGITFLPFRDRKSFNVESNAEALAILQGSLAYELVSIPKTYKKIVIGHFAIEGSIPVGDEIDDLTNELFCPVSMFQGYDYVFMGHVHKPQVLSKSNPYVSHIGSMDISNFGDVDQKKHLISFDLENEEVLEKIILPTRPISKLTISIPDGTKNTTQFVLDQIEAEQANLSKAIVKVEIHLTSQELLGTERQEIEKFLYSKGVFNISGISEQKKLNPIKKDAAMSQEVDRAMDVPSAIKLWASSLEEGKREKFIQASLELLQEFKNKGEGVG